eukprot:Rhum_TRINITY_DN9549_c1_g1::Rhum_TRINITY_DN9549_c1_g1_i1::g.33775::m.33775
MRRRYASRSSTTSLRRRHCSRSWNSHPSALCRFRFSSLLSWNSSSMRACCCFSTDFASASSSIAVNCCSWRFSSSPVRASMRRCCREMTTLASARSSSKSSASSLPDETRSASFLCRSFSCISSWSRRARAIHSCRASAFASATASEHPTHVHCCFADPHPSQRRWLPSGAAASGASMASSSSSSEYSSSSCCCCAGAGDSGVTGVRTGPCVLRTASRASPGRVPHGSALVTRVVAAAAAAVASSAAAALLPGASDTISSGGACGDPLLPRGEPPPTPTPPGDLRCEMGVTTAGRTPAGEARGAAVAEAEVGGEEGGGAEKVEKTGGCRTGGGGSPPLPTGYPSSARSLSSSLSLSAWPCVGGVWVGAAGGGGRSSGPLARGEGVSAPNDTSASQGESMLSSLSVLPAVAAAATAAGVAGEDGLGAVRCEGGGGGGGGG